MYKLWTLKIKKTVLNYCNPGNCYSHVFGGVDGTLNLQGICPEKIKRNRIKANVFNIVYELLVLVHKHVVKCC